MKEDTPEFKTMSRSMASYDAHISDGRSFKSAKLLFRESLLSAIKNVGSEKVNAFFVENLLPKGQKGYQNYKVHPEGMSVAYDIVNSFVMTEEIDISEFPSLAKDILTREASVDMFSKEPEDPAKRLLRSYLNENPKKVKKLAKQDDFFGNKNILTHPNSSIKEDAFNQAIWNLARRTYSFGYRNLGPEKDSYEAKENISALRNVFESKQGLESYNKYLLKESFELSTNAKEPGMNVYKAFSETKYTSAIEAQENIAALENAIIDLLPEEERDGYRNIQQKVNKWEEFQSKDDNKFYEYFPEVKTTDDLASLANVLRNAYHYHSDRGYKMNEISSLEYSISFEKAKNSFETTAKETSNGTIVKENPSDLGHEISSLEHRISSEPAKGVFPKYSWGYY
jgi:hypothetical protein